MEVSFYIQDMAIARNALSNSKLENAVKRHPLLCEVYCHTSMGFPSFYLQVYGGEGYTLLYAKPIRMIHLGATSIGCTFSDTVAADKHPANKGDIYCGIHKLTNKDPVMEMLMNCLPEKDELIPLPAAMLDGVTTIICNHHQGHIHTLLYKDAKDIRENEYSPEQRGFLDELYRSIPLS